MKPTFRIHTPETYAVTVTGSHEVTGVCFHVAMAMAIEAHTNGLHFTAIRESDGKPVTFAVSHFKQLRSAA